MKPIRSIHRAIILAIVAIALTAMNLSAQGQKKVTIHWKGRTVEVIEDEIGIKMKKGVAVSAFSSNVLSLGFTVLDGPDKMGMARVKIPKTLGHAQAIERIQQTGLIEGGDPIIVTHISVSPNDQYYSNQWGLPKVSATAAWDITTGSSVIVVGILDTGIPLQNGSLSHPDLQNTNRITLGNDYMGDGDGVKDKNGHGTHVAGIASAESNNSTGVTGISWNTKIFVVQVFDSTGSGSDYTFYNGVINAVDNGAKIINYSGGGMFSSNYFEQAIIYARNNGRFIVVSAGNYHPTNNPNKIVTWPAAYSTSYDNVMAVSATTSTDALADFSSRGSAVNVAAPGSNIYSTLPNYQVRMNLSPYNKSQNYDYSDGTSMAAPFVSGLAALVFSKNTSLTPQQVRKTIELSALDLGTAGFDTLYGYGRIDANKAVRNLYVPQVYSTIESALSVATSGQAVVVASGTHNVNNNLTVASGITLQIGSGSTVNFTGSYKLRIEGKLEINNATLTRSGGQWYGIEFYNGNAGSSISYVTIENAQYGVYNYGTNVPISNSTIRNNSTGAYIYGNSSTLSWNKIQNNTYGVSCASYGDASIQVNNVLRYNSWAVYGDATSVPALGNYPGYNSLYLNDYYDVYSTYGGTIYARGNWWGSYPAYPSVTANVDYSNALSTDPNGWAGRIVESSNGKELRGLLTKISGSAADDPGMKEVDQAYKLFLNENYEGALGLFQAIALKYPDSFAGSRALVFADRILERLGRDGKSNLESIISQRQNSKVASVANSLLMSRHVKEGNYQVALTSALALAGNTDKLLAKDALYNAGNILWYKLNNTARGAEYFRKLIAEYPGDPLSISAQATLGEWSGKASQPIAQTSLSQTAELSLQNYPNPFNPTTLIHFTLSQSGVVSLKVFDMLGREVATLLNEYRNAGSYQVNFNGSSVTSGVYFYKLETNGRSLIQKMMLVK